MMTQNIPKYHFIEKENEVVFYIPYDREIVNVYTPEFFGLHSQNAEVAAVAFHNNDSLAQKSYVGGQLDIQMPYKFFYNRAKYIDEELKKRFNAIPSKESSNLLFSALIDNARRIFQPQPAAIKNDTPEEDIKSIPVDTSVADDFPEEEPIKKEEVGEVGDVGEVGLPTLLQITIQKKPPLSHSKHNIPNLKIPLDVMLEKEIDYFNEHAPNHTITEKYAQHGIYMVA